MNTKFSLVLLVAIAALLIAACGTGNPDNSAQNTKPAQPSNTEEAAIIPVTGGEASEFVERDVQEPRLWSGEVFTSDNNAPDYGSHIIPNTGDDAKDECISEDDTPRRHGGCIE